MLYWVGSFLAYDKITFFYFEPKFNFRYPGFEWLPRLDLPQFRLLLIVMLVSCFCMMVGFLYRAAATLFSVGFIYIFLLDMTAYQNHYYLVCLLSFLFILVPADSALSIRPTSKWSRQNYNTLPRWALWMLRFQIGVVYFFVGIAKFDSDCIAGFPMREVLASKVDHFLVGSICNQEWFAQMIIWGGLCIDLLAVPFLLYRRTRLVAFLVVVIFHLLNSSLFTIGIFPWAMMLLTTVFFDAGWVEKWLPSQVSSEQKPVTPRGPVVASSVSKNWKSRCLIAFLCLYITAQITVPLRHWLAPGFVHWNERGHNFSWHMMLRGKKTAVRFHIEDKTTGRRGTFPLKPYLKLHQVARMSRDPYMMQQFGKFAAEESAENGFDDVEVKVFALCSLNGRVPDLFIDPAFDLNSGANGTVYEHVLEFTQQLPASPWDEPVDQWEALIMPDPIQASYVKNSRVP